MLGRYRLTEWGLVDALDLGQTLTRDLTVQGETPRLGREPGRTGPGGVHRLHLRPTDDVRAAGRQQATPTTGAGSG